MTTTPEKRTARKMPKAFIAGFGASLGLVVAGTIFLLSSTATGSPNNIAGPPNIIYTTSTASPTATPAAPSSAAPATPLDGATPGAVQSPSGTSNNGSSNGGNKTGTGGSQGSSAPAPAAAAPAPAPDPPAAATSCPWNQSDDPAMWAACRAGYVAPTITFGGIISCSAIDRAAGTWAVTVKWNASGGNYNGGFSGIGSDGSYSFTVGGVTPDGLSSAPVRPPSETVQMYMSSMNGLPGPRIDVVTSSPVGFYPMSQGCS